MPKQDGKCPEVTHTHPRNYVAPVPEMRAHHEKPYIHSGKQSIYSVFDTDLARDNLENDLTAADIQDS